MFKFLDFLTKILGALGADGKQGEIAAATKWVKETFPDTEAQITALEGKLAEILGEHLDPATAGGTLHGIARDIIAGSGGSDAEAWMNSV